MCSGFSGGGKETDIFLNWFIPDSTIDRRQQNHNRGDDQKRERGILFQGLRICYHARQIRVTTVVSDLFLRTEQKTDLM